MQSVVVFGIADPIPAVGGNRLYFGKRLIPLRNLRHERIARDVESDLPAVLPVGDEQQSLVAYRVGLVKHVERLVNGTEHNPFVGLHIDDDRPELKRIAILQQRRFEAAHIPAARGDHRSSVVESIRRTVTGDAVVLGKLINPDWPYGFTRLHGNIGTPLRSRIVVIHRNGKGGRIGTFHFHPGCAGLGRPLGRSRIHDNGERFAPLAQERTGRLADIHVMNLLGRIGRTTARQHKGGGRQSNQNCIFFHKSFGIIC